MEFTFAHPNYLWLLFAVPLFFLIHFLSLGNKKKKALSFANFDAIARIQGVDFFSKNVFVLFLNVVIVVAVIFAASGFTYHTLAESSDFSFVLAIDSSQSMEATDFSPSRFEAAKEVAHAFVDGAPRGVSMGIITFGGSSKIELDITQRKDDLHNALDNLAIGGFGGTDLFEAVLTSTNLLKGEEAKAVILLSDGQINVGDIQDTIRYANDNEVVVHTIGMGTLAGGETQYGLSRLDMDTLRGLAYETSGRYFNATDKAELQRAYGSMYSVTRKKVAIPLADYLLILAVILLLVEFFLTNTKYINLI